MPSDKTSRWLEDIVDNIARIARFTAGLDYKGFVADDRPRLKRAVERALDDLRQK